MKNHGHSRPSKFDSVFHVLFNSSLSNVFFFFKYLILSHVGWLEFPQDNEHRKTCRKTVPIFDKKLFYSRKKKTNKICALNHLKVSVTVFLFVFEIIS